MSSEIKGRLSCSYGKSITAALLAILLFAGVAMARVGPVEMLMLFWGNGYVSTLEMVDTLEMLDTLEMN
jgi:hypothetical protein